MRTITPLRDKVIGRMIDGFGERTTNGGLIMQEAEGSEQSIRPRWFEVIAVGPEQTDVAAGDFILVPHGRWSRGLDIEGTNRKEDMVFNIDMEAALATSTDNPLD